MLHFALCTLIGCGSSRRDEPVTKTLDLSPNPRLTLGQQIFNRNCHQCHPFGSAAIGPSLNDKPMMGVYIKYQVRHGLGAMPAFDESQMPEDQLDAVVDYLQALRALH
jgi:mono/diheme cytochrome c family protein